MRLMNWDDTVASKCRYGDIVGDAFGDPKIIWESSYDDYQGYANIFGITNDGRYFHYDWSYGSCAGCDEWEAQNYSYQEIMQIIRDTAAIFKTKEHAMKYLKLEEDVKYPAANSIINGAFPGMIRMLSCQFSNDFDNLRETVMNYFNDKEN